MTSSSPETIEIIPLVKPPVARVRPPGSKSITNRALVCAALADGRSTLRGALDSEDTQVMVDSLRKMGIPVEHDLASAEMTVDGCACRPPADGAELYIANSGTTVRFLTAAATLGHGTFTLDGTKRMRERPIADLIDALAGLGAFVESESLTGCPPVTVRADGLKGGTTRVAGDISSQFLSALLMAAPGARGDVTVEVTGRLVSVPYIEMTVEVMRSFGAKVSAADDLARFDIPADSSYTATDYQIEPDASAASYFFAAAAICGGTITVEGLSKGALQGDIDFCDCLAQMGCTVEYGDGETTVTGPERLKGIDVDMNAISDTVQTLGAVALFADGPTTVRNVAHIRHKETDRIGDLATELRKLGAQVDECEEGLTITPGELHGAEIDTYDDHRMAMSLALAGLRIPGVVIKDPGCTGKTYPLFFEDLDKLRTK